MKTKTKKNIKEKNNKKNTMKGGAYAMIKQNFKKITGDDICDLSLDYLSQLEKTAYSPNKMLKKADESEFLIKEDQGFKKNISINLKTFCGSSKGNRYLKFCSNLFSCLKEPILIYEVLNDIFDLNIKKNPKLKSLYNQKKKFKAGLTINEFYETEKKSRSETIAMFLVKVLFKSINEYELKHPPKYKSPTDSIFLKENIILVLKNVGINVNIKTEKVDQLKEKILNNESSIIDYYMTRLSSITDEQSVRELKEKKSSSFLFIVIGLFFGTIFLRSNFFDSRPGISGSIT